MESRGGIRSEDKLHLFNSTDHKFFLQWKHKCHVFCLGFTNGNLICILISISTLWYKINLLILTCPSMLTVCQALISTHKVLLLHFQRREIWKFFSELQARRENVSETIIIEVLRLNTTPPPLPPLLGSSPIQWNIVFVHFTSCIQKWICSAESSTSLLLLNNWTDNVWNCP